MPKFVQLPIVVEADQYLEDSVTGKPLVSIPGVTFRPGLGGATQAVIWTPGGNINVASGDYIVTQDDGTKTICKKRYFEKTHKLLENKDEQEL